MTPKKTKKRLYSPINRELESSKVFSSRLPEANARPFSLRKKRRSE
jgi:hypothetical protein